MADAYTQSPEVGRPELRLDIAKAVVAGDAAAQFQLRFARAKIKFVVNDQQLRGRHREKTCERRDGAPRIVHERRRLCETQVALLANIAREARLMRQRNAELRGERIGEPETGVVPRGDVMAARISQSRDRSEEHTSELQSRRELVCRLLLEKKKKINIKTYSHKKKKKNSINKQ